MGHVLLARIRGAGTVVLWMKYVYISSLFVYNKYLFVYNIISKTKTRKLFYKYKKILKEISTDAGTVL